MLTVPDEVATLLLDPGPDGTVARRELTRANPELFGRIYFADHLALPDHGISLAPFHEDLCSHALRWMEQDLAPQAVREAWVAPRGAGKSTWGFLILPAWALAHGHRTFVAAYADTATQAQGHLTTLKREMETNALLQRDYPELCRPAVRPRTGASVADTQQLYVASSGAVIMARGIDSSTLGAKYGSKRPDLLLFDDIEPEESNYSSDQKDKRLATILSAVFPMNLNAVVLFLGTTTMPGSIIHDLVRQVTEAGHDQLPVWPRDEHIQVNYYPALLADPLTGGRVSLWPERWSTEYLESVSHTRAFSLNFMNDPMARDGDYWTADDIRYGQLDALTRQALFVDPAVTTKGKSDWTGLAVVGFQPQVPGRDGKSATPSKVLVRWAGRVKLANDELRARVLKVLQDYPRVRAVVVEVNQGGELWQGVFKDLPRGVKLIVHTVSASKEVRFAEALRFYQDERVLHEERLPILEAEMVAFPKVKNDDVADAAVSGVLRFLSPPKRQRVGGKLYD